jgi:flagellar biosynthesis protein FlhF
VPKHGVRGWLGGREVEVTAAVDHEVSAVRPPAQRNRPVADAPPGDDPIVARLCAGGLDAALASEVAATLPAASRRGASFASLRGALASRLAALAVGDEPYASVEVFVGPPGAGKTTTVAKIAAQERARRGRRIAMIAADGFRVGAVEQLRLYSDIIGSPFTVARTAADLEHALDQSAGPVLVDTAGRSPEDAPVRDLFAVLSGREGVRTHLVIPASSSARSVARMFAGYRTAAPQRVVLTRIDEAESLSPLVGVLREQHVPISYLCTGQRVPEDLERATAPLLAACVLGENAHGARGTV